MTSKLDVLVVDDDPDIRTLLVLLLEEHELEVRTARNGREAYELAIALHPRLVLSDLMMPVMRGDALYAALQANATTAGITFVLMTANPAKVPSRIGRVVSKPIELAALEALLLEALRERP
jgi:CheY-like chemotaxis protein